jgi:hypothetical protein
MDRKLAAILVADVGYGRLAGGDEEWTLRVFEDSASISSTPPSLPLRARFATLAFSLERFNIQRCK